MTPTPAPAASLSGVDRDVLYTAITDWMATKAPYDINERFVPAFVGSLTTHILSHFATERKSPDRDALQHAVDLVLPLMERYEGQGEGGTAEFTIAMEALRHAAKGTTPERKSPFPRANGPVHYKCDTDTHVLFYEQDFYVLSNFSAFNVSFGIDPYLVRRFQTSEHAYHFQKFVFPGAGGMSINARSDITNAPSAHEAFKAAERLKQFRNPDWDAVKVDIMRDILRAKVDQHEYVRRKLLATGDRILVEDSWRDDFWGWGQNMDGQNMLGKLWMEVRAELRATAPQPPAEGQ